MTSSTGTLSTTELISFSEIATALEGPLDLDTVRLYLERAQERGHDSERLYKIVVEARDPNRPDPPRWEEVRPKTSSPPAVLDAQSLTPGEA